MTKWTDEQKLENEEFIEETEIIKTLNETLESYEGTDLEDKLGANHYANMIGWRDRLRQKHRLNPQLDPEEWAQLKALYKKIMQEYPPEA